MTTTAAIRSRSARSALTTCIFALAAAALCLAPATASAYVTKCGKGKNTDLMCINFNRTIIGKSVRLDSTWAAVHQGGCGVGGDFHVDITVQSNEAVIKPIWQKLPGRNKWTINGPHWKKYDTATTCWNGTDLLVPFNPLPPDRIRLAQKLWPKGYFVCAVLWNYHGNNNYSQDAVVCQKM